MDTNIYRNFDLVEANAEQGSLTQKFTEEAVEFITQNADNPFFLYLPYTAPHSPVVPSAAFEGTSAAGPYGDVVEELDWGVGQILQKLKDLNIDEKTLVVFTSDNGPDLNYEFGGNADPLRGGKFGELEGGHRMPCVMRWPNTVPAGTVCSEIASTMDFYTTFAYLAGVDVPTDRVIDGKNIFPLMTDEPGAVSPYEYFLYFERWTEGDFRAIRKGKWKVIDNWGIPVLYDLENDIGESTNVAAQNPAVADELFALYKSAEADIMANARSLGNVYSSKVEKGTPSSGNVKSKPGIEIRQYVNLSGQRIAPGAINTSKGVYFRKTAGGKFKRVHKMQ